MRILVLQLARFGDILMTAPVLKALKRTYPDAEFDLAVRSKFQEASEQLEGISSVRILSTPYVLEPLLSPEMNEEETIKRAADFVRYLQSQKYDQIINLSFSPASSQLTALLETETTEVRGYSRYADGSFRICDEASEYFYAQAGVGQFNRFHLINLMGAVAGVEVTDEDMQLNAVPLSRLTVPPQTFAIHIGASQEGKKVPALKWVSFIREFSELNPEASVILLGSKGEESEAEKIASSCSHGNVYNYVGKTKWSDVFSILAKCRALIAADSSLVHAGGLVGTACFNLSNPTVNFWETGPRAAGSHVYFQEDFDLLDTREVALKVTQMAEGSHVEDTFKGIGGTIAFEGAVTPTEFQWNLVAALYWGAEFPLLSRPMTEAVQHLTNLNDVVLENLRKAEKTEAEFLAQILRRADELQNIIAKQFPLLQPLFRYLEAERLRVPPGTREEIIQHMINCHERCAGTLQAFVESQTITKEMDHEQL